MVALVDRDFCIAGRGWLVLGLVPEIENLSTVCMAEIARIFVVAAEVGKHGSDEEDSKTNKKLNRERLRWRWISSRIPIATADSTT